MNIKHEFKRQYPWPVSFDPPTEQNQNAMNHANMYDWTIHSFPKVEAKNLNHQYIKDMSIINELVHYILQDTNAIHDL